MSLACLGDGELCVRCQYIQLLVVVIIWTGTLTFVVLILRHLTVSGRYMPLPAPESVFGIHNECAQLEI
jgi:hypothetical protein